MPSKLSSFFWCAYSTFFHPACTNTSHVPRSATSQLNTHRTVPFHRSPGVPSQETQLETSSRTVTCHPSSGVHPASLTIRCEEQLPPYTLRPSRDESQSGHPGALSYHDRAEKPPVIKPSDCLLPRHSLKEGAFSLVRARCVFPGDWTE